MDFDESIYNLIPKTHFNTLKPKRYKSVYPPYIAPTGTTLALTNTSKPGVANLAGKFHFEGGHHPHKAPYATFGTIDVVYADPRKFVRKGTGHHILEEKHEGKFFLIKQQFSC